MKTFLTTSSAILKPGMVVKINNGVTDDDGNIEWVKYRITDDEEIVRRATGEYLFSAVSEHYPDQNHSSPMVVAPHRILVRYQHEGTGNIDEATLDKEMSERYYPISFQ